jgi:hypothetical protein
MTAQTTASAASTGTAMMSAFATRDGDIWTPTLTTTARSIPAHAIHAATNVPAPMPILASTASTMRSGTTGLC